GTEIVTTDPVAMELLAGARNRREVIQLEALVDGLLRVEVDPSRDFRAAAELFRASRANGHPIRSMVDCLIAAVAIRRGIPLLHDDRDYDRLAEISPLRIA